MNRSAKILFSALALVLLSSTAARADWGSCTYGGYQPWWNIFAHRNHCQTCEEKRLQKFWHDYYDAQARYFRGLEHLDWVAYYKNHGYRINGGCGGGYPGCDGPVQFAPVGVTPGMQWATPSSAAGCAPPIGPSGPYAGPMGSGPMGPVGPGPMSCGPMGCGPTGPMGPMGQMAPVPAGYNNMGYMGGYAPGMGMPMPVTPAGYYTYGQPTQP